MTEQKAEEEPPLHPFHPDDLQSHGVAEARAQSHPGTVLGPEVADETGEAEEVLLLPLFSARALTNKGQTDGGEERGLEQRLKRRIGGENERASDGFVLHFFHSCR